MAIKISRGGGNIIRGGASLLGLTFKGEKAREKVAELGELLAGSLEDGVEIEIVAPRVRRMKPGGER